MGGGGRSRAARHDDEDAREQSPMSAAAWEDEDVENQEDEEEEDEDEDEDLETNVEMPPELLDIGPEETLAAWWSRVDAWLGALPFYTWGAVTVPPEYFAKMGDEGLNAIFDLEHAERIFAIEVQGPSVPREAIDNFLKRLVGEHAPRNITELVLQGVAGAASDDAIAQVIREGHLRVLKILFSFRKKQAALAGAALSNNDELEVFEVSECSIGGAAASQIFKACGEERCGVTELVMESLEPRTEDDDYGAACAAMIASPSCNLRYLWVCGREITRDGARQVIDALTRNTTIVELVGCDLVKRPDPTTSDPGTVAAIQRLFRENNTLEKIDFSGADSGDDEADNALGRSFIPSLRENKTLLDVHLDDYGMIGEDAQKEINAAVREGWM